MYRFSFLKDIHQIESQELFSLYPNEVFCRFEFLAGLQDSGCVDGDSGWHSQHLLVHHQQQLVAFLPMYRKDHSYGEYIFDWAWANAYHQHGIEYYPKLVAAIPYSPVPGSRLLHSPSHPRGQLISHITDFLTEHCHQQGLSSFHVLFNTQAEQTDWLGETLGRSSVQFHWHNQNYQSMDEFLNTLKSRKRKNLVKERQQLSQTGWHFERISGGEISETDMAFFYRCYCQTYRKLSGHNGYLNLQFFNTLRETMQEQLLLVVAQHNQQAQAAALFFHSNDTLYGRYWGCLQEHPGLHFETCYYQGIEYCIEHQLTTFNPGTQGEHKISRGFLPQYCYSNHWLAQPDFHQAVGNFVAQEREHLKQYVSDANGLSPFKVNNT